MAHKSKTTRASKAPKQKSKSVSRVDIKKANNGFVVSSFDDDFGERRVMVAKTKREANKLANDMLGV